ncbi:MAG: hypothetical protein KAI81_03910, partial [Candidatus Marinimicrobia bacterium]|nr:hypothetical protein [Candidatus Neomarinimicrobiota bacterium]
ATLAVYQTILRSLRYKNSNDNPSSTLRSVRFQLYDNGGGSEAQTIHLKLIPVNDSPFISFTNSDLEYRENANPINLINNLLIQDLDDTKLESAQIRIAGGYQAIEDTLIISNSGQLTQSFDDLTGSLTLSGSALLTVYHDILELLVYENSSDNPDTTSRQIEFVINDGQDSSLVMSRKINILSVNDAPVLADILDQNMNEDTELSIILSAADVDSDELIFEVSSSEPQLMLDLIGRELTMQPVRNWFGTADITIIVQDNNSENPRADSFTFKLIVDPVNDAPVAISTNGYGPYGGMISIPLSASDVDNSDPAAFSFDILSPPKDIEGDVSIGGINYDSGTFTAMATYLHNGKGAFIDSFLYRANDGSANSNTAIARRMVNPADFDYSANVTAVLQLNYLPIGENTMIAAYSGDICVGISEPQYELNQWMYFLTIYSDSLSENLNFYAWIAEEDSIFLIDESINFQPQTSTGTLLDPFVMNVITNYDYAPILTDIPDQKIEIGMAFTTFDLDDYVERRDEDNISFTALNSTNLTVALTSDHKVTVTINNLDWTGSEELIFSVTDQTGTALSTEDKVLFTVLPLDHPPVFADIPSQKVGYYQPFEAILLSDYLTEIDGDNQIWDYQIISGDTKDPLPEWTFDASLEMSMTYTASIHSQGNLADGNTHTLAVFAGEDCRGTTQATKFMDTWVYFLIIYSDTDDVALSFRFYDAGIEMNLPIIESFNFSSGASIGTPQLPETLNAGHFLVDIDNKGLVSLNQVEA